VSHSPSLPFPWTPPSKSFSLFCRHDCRRLEQLRSLISGHQKFLKVKDSKLPIHSGPPRETVDVYAEMKVEESKSNPPLTTRRFLSLPPQDNHCSVSFVAQTRRSMKRTVLNGFPLQFPLSNLNNESQSSSSLPLPSL
jgi:hypothetical protein